jgi:hypothetical protein
VDQLLQLELRVDFQFGSPTAEPDPKTQCVSFGCNVEVLAGKWRQRREGSNFCQACYNRVNAVPAWGDVDDTVELSWRSQGVTHILPSPLAQACPWHTGRASGRASMPGPRCWPWSPVARPAFAPSQESGFLCSTPPPQHHKSSVSPTPGKCGPNGGNGRRDVQKWVLEPRNISAVTLQRQEVGPDNLPAPLNLEGELGLNFTKRYEPGKPREAVCSEPSVHLCSWPSTVTQIPTITVLRSCWPCIRHSRFSQWQCGTNANLLLATYSAFEAFHDLSKVSLFY